MWMVAGCFFGEFRGIHPALPAILLEACTPRSPVRPRSRACPAPRPDWTVDQHWERYRDEEHAVWRRLYECQSRLLPGRACDDYLAGLRASQLDYLEEPDVFHDVFGHVPMLMNPVTADFVQAYGMGGCARKGSACWPNWPGSIGTQWNSAW